MNFKQIFFHGIKIISVKPADIEGYLYEEKNEHMP